MEAACRVTEVQIGSAVSARVADSTFGQAVDRIGTERLATAEVMMIDLLLQRLAETRDDKEKDKDKDKAVLALWQALREDRRRPAGRPALGGAQKQVAEKEAAASGGTGPAEAATGRAAEIAGLIAAVEARLAAAEAGEGKP
jgi:hypothetical protein